MTTAQDIVGRGGADWQCLTVAARLNQSFIVKTIHHVLQSSARLSAVSDAGPEETTSGPAHVDSVSKRLAQISPR
jgi:hypothetical protein